MKLKKLPLDTSTFRLLIEEGYLYVDKTKHIFDLIENGRYYFLSRPRRFGKSLLISTLKEIFLGNKELFKDLWITKNTDYAFEEHPVIHLDFSAIQKETPEILEKSLMENLKEYGKIYGINNFDKETSADVFKALVLQLAKKKRVVLLIDEYDDPIVRHITDTDKANANRKVLQAFYKMVKSLDEHIHFVFITGISKFSKTSVFSGMNNLNDISLDAPTSTLLGYTHQELTDYFHAHLEKLAKKLNLSLNDLLKKLKHYYNGYRFSEEGEPVYNPFSITYCFSKEKITNYWFESGTPTFLVELLQGRADVAQEIATMKKGYLKTTEIIAFDPKNLPIKTLLFQTGYLTIIGYDDEFGEYIVGFPNKEVEDSLRAYLVLALSDVNIETVHATPRLLQRSLHDGDFATFVRTLQTLLAGIPYHIHIPDERYYHTLLHLALSMAHLNPESEVPTSHGRIDMVLHTSKTIYILEFKYNHSVEKALSQIERKRYTEKYRLEGKEIVAIGLSFSSEEKKLTLEYEEKVV